MFPAAQSILKRQEGNKEESPSPDWLNNPSYQIQEPSISSRDAGHVISTEESSDDASPRHKRRHRRTSSDDEQYSKKKVKEKRKHKHRKHKKSSHIHKTPSEPKKPNTIWISETNFEPKDAYRIDSKSDQTNLNYDTLYSNDQASYKRYYGNHCLGLEPGQNIKFTDKRNRKKHKHNSDIPLRYFEGEIEPTESTELKFDYKLDIFDVRFFRSQMGHELGYPEEEEEEEEMKKNEKPILDPLPSILLLETEATTMTPTNYLQKKVEAYNKLFYTSEGDNEDLWIEYINFQDELYQWSSIPSDNSWSTRDLKKKFRKTVGEKKIAIYEEAMKRLPNSTKLIIGYMETVEDVWDNEKVLAKWKDVVFFHANKSILWAKYIEACMSSFSVYQTNSIIAVFVKAIDTLASIVEGKLLSHRPETDADKRLLAMFVFYCYFLRLSGYTERAVATFQSLIEFNYFASYDLYPTSCYHPRIGRRKGLRSFWESDMPKFGEDGAMGWSKSVPDEKGRMSSPEILGLYEPKDFDKLLCLDEEEEKEKEDEYEMDLRLVADQPMYKAWPDVELRREFSNSLPGRIGGPLRSTVNRDDEDPEHVVFFEDIVEVQFIIIDPNLLRLLCLEFLRFLGAPTPGTSIVQSCFPFLENILSFGRYSLIRPHYLFNNFRMEGLDLTSYYFNPASFGEEYKLTDCGFEFAFDCFSESHFMSSLPTLQYKFSPQMKHFVSTVFNQTLGLRIATFHKNPPHSNMEAVISYSWLFFELAYIKQLKMKKKDVSALVGQLHTLAIKLLDKFTCRNYSFLWDFTFELEVLMEIETPSDFSQAIFAPFRDTSYDFDNMFSMAQAFVEYHLGLKPRLNFFSAKEQAPNVLMAIHALFSLRHYEFDPVNMTVPVYPDGISRLSLSISDDGMKTKEFFDIQTQRILQRYRSKMIGLNKDSFFIHFPKIACHLYFIFLIRDNFDFIKRCGDFITEISQLASDESLPNHTSLVPFIEGILVLRTRLLLTPYHQGYFANYSMSKKSFFFEEPLCEFPSHSWFLEVLSSVEGTVFFRSRLQSFCYSLTHSTRKYPLRATQVLSAARGMFHKALQQGTPMSIEDVYELRRLVSMYEKASEFRTCRLCPAFWRSYMRVLIAMYKREEAKRIFYQGLYYCPGAKVLYTDAILYFPDDIEKVLEIAEEKLIRMRTPLEVITILQEEAKEKGIPKAEEDDDYNWLF